MLNEAKKIEKSLPEFKAKPILKWAGGKQQLIKEITRHAPEKYGKYIEPFIGGGAVFFEINPQNAIISDTNPELINLYIMVRDNVEDLIYALKVFENTEDYYYKVRALKPEALSQVERAARMVYLNKTCFNGLYRVNKAGQFNVPYGRYKKPNICDEKALRAASNALQGKEIICMDYLDVLREYAKEGDFIYLDPPYLPISQYADFKRYTKEFFYEEDHISLAKEVKRLFELGCTVILTNSNNPLVYELYKDFKIELHQTKRYINCDAKSREGHDVIVVAEPKRYSRRFISSVDLPPQIDLFPGTRYMGSKQNLLFNIWDVLRQHKFDTVLDAFSGSGCVSYMLKAQGKQVLSNDFLAYSATITKALIENNDVKVTPQDIQLLLEPNGNTGFILDTFKGLYFADEEYQFLDNVRLNVEKLNDQYKKAIAIASLCRACLKRRPRGVFTYTGERYNDGRKDLCTNIRDHFLESIKLFNEAVFDNNKNNQSFNRDTMELRVHADLVYLDPPYFSPLSDNEYTRRYHFIEGLAKYWDGLDIQQETKTKKFKKYPTPFGSKVSAYDAFSKLFQRHKDSIIAVSYSSNALPTMEEMLGLLSEVKGKVEIYKIEHQYSFGTQQKNFENNKVQEYVFIGY